MIEKEQLIAMVCDVQQGLDGAATELYNACYYDIYGHILNAVNDRELAKDLTQNAFMEIFMSIGKLEEPAAFLTWSKQIAYHRCTAYFRKKHDLLADELEDHSALDAIEEYREEFLPGALLDRENLKKALRGMIDELPPEQRNAILMRYFEELPIKEIAQRQGVTEGTVKSRLNYGRQAIKRAVQEYEKKNDVKLYSTAIVPMLLWLFREYKVVNGISLTAQVASAALTAETAAGAAAAVAAGTAGASVAAGAAAGTSAAAGAAAGVSSALAVKIIAGVAAVAVSVGGVTAAVVTRQDPVQPDPPPETTVAAEASELSFALSSDGTHYEVRGLATAAVTQVTIPSEYNGLPVTSVGDYAFLDCNHLTQISLPDSITAIGQQAFSGCSGLQKLNIPAAVTEIATGTFLGCSGLSRVLLPEGVASIGSAAFWGCNGLEQLELPGSVTSIGAGAFGDCSSLTGLFLPANVATIGNRTFAGCTGLEYISVAPANPFYRSAGNCLIETAGKKLLRGFTNSVIPTDGSVAVIDAGAFENDKNLTQITIPASVSLIQPAAFSGCVNLRDIYYTGTMSQWDAVTHSLDTDGIGDYTVHCTEGVVYQGNHQAIVPEAQRGLIFTLSDDGTFYRVTPDSTAIAHPVIPAEYRGLPVRRINFMACENLTGITIANTVAEIETEAFAFCGSLTAIALPGSITSIGDSAFTGCGSLKSVTIPVSVASLGRGVFNECTALTEISYLGTREQWNAIRKDSRWDTGMGPYSIQCVDGRISQEVAPEVVPEGSVGLHYSLNPDGITYAVSGRGSCEDAYIVIPDRYKGLSVTTITEEAFYGDKTVTGIQIPASVTLIEAHIIGENPKLEKLTVEKGNPVYHSDGNCIVETASKTLLAGCKTSLIPTDGSITHIAEHAFYFSGLTEVTVPDTVVFIGNNAFSHNMQLKSISLPVSVTALPKHLLAICGDLSDIYYAGTVEQWNALKKDDYWIYETGSYTIHCMDGDLPQT